MGLGLKSRSSGAVAASPRLIAEVESSAPRISRLLKNVAAGNHKVQDLSRVFTKMSKRNNDGDVIANRLNLVEAKGQRFLASLLGPQPAAHETTTALAADDDLKEDFGHDR
jgi:hypothetical protein